MEKTRGKAVAGGLGWASQQLEDPLRQGLTDWAVPHLCADKLGLTTGERNRPNNPGFQCGEKKPQSLRLKTPVGEEPPSLRSAASLGPPAAALQ